MKFELDIEGVITLDQFEHIMQGNALINISDATLQKVNKAYTYLQGKIKNTDSLLYGINTGFGSLCNVRIQEKQLAQLQINLIRSHACGAGKRVPKNIARLILYLKIKSLSAGYSGISTELILRLVTLFNHDLIPVMYEQGSLGASGDLAPLAHLSLVLLGEGEAYDEENIITGAEVLRKLNVAPYELQAKEGLALINGTQFSLGYLTAAYVKAQQLQEVAIRSAILSLQAYDCRLEPFYHQIHDIRKGNGQPEIADRIYQALKDSPNMKAEKSHVQDPYSFRCIPQVHGATYNALKFIGSTIENEINSVTDNPNVFADDDMVISGGNFHAQPLALASDFLGMAMAEIGNISERRTYLMISGQRGLPPFLTTHAGLESGFMIAQYTAASIVSMNKQLATPSSVDSIVSSNGQEDHVSMAANAGVKVVQILENVSTVLAIEYQIAAQALEMRNVEVSNETREELSRYRQFVAFLDHDRVLHNDFLATKKYFETL